MTNCPALRCRILEFLNANVSSSPPARESSSPPSPVIEAPQLAETRECETAAEQAWLQEVFSNLNIDNTSTETSPPEDLEFFDCDISPSINEELEFFFRVISSIVSPISARWYYSAAELNSHHFQLIDKGNFAPCLSACDTDTATTASDHLGVTDEQSYHVVIYDANGQILKDVQVSWNFYKSVFYCKTQDRVFAILHPRAQLTRKVILPRVSGLLTDSLQFLFGIDSKQGHHRATRPFNLKMPLDSRNFIRVPSSLQSEQLLDLSTRQVPAVSKVLVLYPQNHRRRKSSHW